MNAIQLIGGRGIDHAGQTSPSLRAQILIALAAWINQRPGVEPGNYGDWSSYRCETRRITRQRRDALLLLSAVSRSPIAADALLACFNRRLTAKIQPDQSVKLDYCTGQYWCVEYRAGACQVLASALWAQAGKTMPTAIQLQVINMSAGDYLRTHFRRCFGKRIQKQYFTE